ncbi:MAG: ATP-dependent helicase [Nitrososphaerota archaeon]|nr:ATP-dependent helicase [Nitrososphaerota archaeon]
MDVPDEFDKTVQAIVPSKKQAQLVVAAAGSGKTRLLVEALSRRIEAGITDPTKDNVVVFTFTNNAANELVVRLSSALEGAGHKDIISRIFIGTIHGWCNNLLRDTGVLANTKVVDELEQAQIVQRVYPILGLKNLYAGKNQFDRIDGFLADLELFYNESLELDSKDVPDNVRTAIENYMTFMKSQRLLDFGALIREATRRLEEAGQAETGLDVYVDEYQDVNPAQVGLLQAMLENTPKSRMLAVADPRQSIYQWRGSDFSRTLSFGKDFKDSQVYEITVNHRSRTGIVNYANLVAREMPFGKTFEVRDMNVSPERRDQAISVVLDDATTPNEEAVVDGIKGLIESKVKPGEIAILLRSVLNHGQPIMDALDRVGVPYYSPNRNAGIGFVQDFMLSVLDLLQIADQPPEPANREEEIELTERVQVDLSKISRYCKVKDTKKIHAKVTGWHAELMKDGKRPKNERYNFRQQFFDFCEGVGLEIDTDDSTLQEGFSAITQIMRAVEEAYRRRFLSGYQIRGPPVDVLTHNVKWQLEHELERWTEVGMTTARSDAVTVSTVHAAKGLEWPVVIIPFAWENRFPTRRSSHGTSFSDDLAGRYGTTVEDERRLWYVAVTRARDRLYIFSGSEDRKPSQFVNRGAFNGEAVGLLDSSRIKSAQLSTIERYTRPYYLHLGVSDLLLLLECPYHFYLRHLMGADVPVGEELGAGNIAHRVIQRVIEESPRNLDDVVREEVYLPLGEPEHEMRTRKSVESKVKRLISTGILKDVDRSEYRFSFRLGDMVVSGIVDATKPTGSSLTLVDWKFSVHEEYEHRYEGQLRTYAFGLRSNGTNVNNAILYDLSQKGKLAELQVDVSDAKSQMVVKLADERYKRLALAGPYTTPSKISCNACDVSQVCPDSLVRKKR